MASLLAVIGLNSCGDGFPSQKKGEELTRKFVENYYRGNFDEIEDVLPHDERVTGNLTLMKGFMEGDIQKVEKLGGIKKIEFVKTSMLENTENGPTEITVTYQLHFKKSKSLGKVMAEARIIDGKWYLTSNNYSISSRKTERPINSHFYPISPPTGPATTSLQRPSPPMQIPSKR